MIYETNECHRERVVVSCIVKWSRANGDIISLPHSLPTTSPTTLLSSLLFASLSYLVSSLPSPRFSLVHFYICSSYPTPFDFSFLSFSHTSPSPPPVPPSFPSLTHSSRDITNMKNFADLKVFEGSVSFRGFYAY